MDSITIKDEFIKLGHAMKLASMVSSGVDAKMVITEGQVKVNGEVCLQRGKKLYSGDVIEYNNQKVSIN